jgi:hypothetical protein
MKTIPNPAPWCVRAKDGALLSATSREGQANAYAAKCASASIAVDVVYEPEMEEPTRGGR